MFGAVKKDRASSVEGQTEEEECQSFLPRARDPSSDGGHERRTRDFTWIWKITTILFAVLFLLQAFLFQGRKHGPDTYETGFSTDLGMHSHPSLWRQGRRNLEEI